MNATAAPKFIGVGFGEEIDSIAEDGASASKI
jgi:hypothetical protein